MKKRHWYLNGGITSTPIDRPIDVMGKYLGSCPEFVPLDTHNHFHEVKVGIEVSSSLLYEGKTVKDPDISRFNKYMDKQCIIDGEAIIFSKEHLQNILSLMGDGQVLRVEIRKRK